MSTLVAKCPRCDAQKMTFDVLAQVHRYTRYEWQNWFEIFSVCRHCTKPTVFLVGLHMDAYNHRAQFYQEGGLVKFKDALNPYFEIERYISLRDNVAHEPPEHLPDNIAKAFNEGATCLSVGAGNGAACMFRLCIDLATKPLLPALDASAPVLPNTKQRRDLGLRLAWLLDNGKLPGEFRELAKCIREDANDGAHVGNLSKEDAEDILDFTTSLLERLITEPKRVELAEERRMARRAGAAR